MAALTPPDPALADQSVVLRRWEPADAPAIARIAADPEVPRWTYLPEGMTEERAAYWIGRGHEAAESGTGLPLAITAAQDGAVLGNVGLGAVDRRLGTAELFWWLDVDHRGRGIATRAVWLLAGWALDGLRLDRVTALIEPGNARSLAVAERAGFQREGVLRAAEPSSDGAGRIDLMVLSLLRTDPRC